MDLPLVGLPDIIYRESSALVQVSDNAISNRSIKFEKLSGNGYQFFFIWTSDK